MELVCAGGERDTTERLRRAGLAHLSGLSALAAAPAVLARRLIVLRFRRAEYIQPIRWLVVATMGRQ